MLLQKVPGAAPPGPAGPGALPPLGGSTSPRSSPAVRPNLGYGRWEGGDGPPETLHRGLSSLPRLCVHLLGGLIGIHSTFGLPDAFGLELAHLTPKPWGFF